MLKSVRQESLLQLLHARGSVTVAEVSEALNVSGATARRDISNLVATGLAARTWGGVRLISTIDDPFQDSLTRDGASKQRIGAAAAALVPDGATIILDIGTTTHYAALALQARDLTVITASLPTFEHLRSVGGANIILLGGQWSEQYLCFDGIPVVDALAHLQADLAFLGCSGLSGTGRIRDTSSTQSMVKKAICEASTRTYLLAGAEKVPGKGTGSPFALTDLDGWITDSQGSTQVERSLLEQCSQHGIEVLQV